MRIKLITVSECVNVSPMKCKQCNEEFEAQRSTARFCSSKCRLDYFRSLSENSGPGDRGAILEISKSLAEPLFEEREKEQYIKPDGPKMESKPMESIRFPDPKRVRGPRIYPDKLPMEDPPGTIYGISMTSRMRRIKSYNESFRGTRHEVTQSQVEQWLSDSGYDVKLAKLAF